MGRRRAGRGCCAVGAAQLRWGRLGSREGSIKAVLANHSPASRTSDARRRTIPSPIPAVEAVTTQTLPSSLLNGGQPETSRVVSRRKPAAAAERPAGKQPPLPWPAWRCSRALGTVMQTLPGHARGAPTPAPAGGHAAGRWLAGKQSRLIVSDVRVPQDTVELV